LGGVQGSQKLSKSQEEKSKTEFGGGDWQSVAPLPKQKGVGKRVDNTGGGPVKKLGGLQGGTESAGGKG